MKIKELFDLIDDDEVVVIEDQNNSGWTLRSKEDQKEFLLRSGLENQNIVKIRAGQPFIRGSQIALIIYIRP